MVTLTDEQAKAIIAFIIPPDRWVNPARAAVEALALIEQGAARKADG